MLTKYILGGLAILYLILGIARFGRGGAAAKLQIRIWLLIAVIFGAVSAWLFYQEAV